MERLCPYRKLTASVTAILSSVAISSCSIEIVSSVNDPVPVTCDDQWVEVNRSGDGVDTFVAHGDNNKTVTIQVRRENNETSVKTTGDVTGPPQQLESDGYTIPTRIVKGPELSTFGIGCAFVIDASTDSVKIMGSDSGM